MCAVVYDDGWLVLPQSILKNGRAKLVLEMVRAIASIHLLDLIKYVVGEET
jgi:hypothetical protein